MNTEELEKFPYFTGRMLKAFLKKKHPSTTLTRWKHKLTKIEKGKYTVQTDSLVYATTIISPSYCSFRSALYFYGLTTQIPVFVQVALAKRKRHTKHIQFITIPKKEVFGYSKFSVSSFDVFIANKEKLLIDCLNHPKAGVPPSELSMLLQEPLDKKRIINYLHRISNVNLIKRAGYVLECVNIDIYSEFTQQLVSNKNYPALHPLLPKGTQLNKKWKLYINDEIEL